MGEIITVTDNETIENHQWLRLKSTSLNHQFACLKRPPLYNRKLKTNNFVHICVTIAKHGRTVHAIRSWQTHEPFKKCCGFFLSIVSVVWFGERWPHIIHSIRSCNFAQQQHKKKRTVELVYRVYFFCAAQNPC